MERGIGATPKDTAYIGIKRGRKMTARDVRIVATLPRSQGKQLLTRDITTGYQLDRALDELTTEWLRKHDRIRS